MGCSLHFRFLFTGLLRHFVFADASRRVASIRKDEEHTFRTKAASDFCASKSDEFGPCCLSSTFPLLCGLPQCVCSALETLVSPSEIREAKEMIRSGISQQPFSCHKTSETGEGATVDQVTGGAFEEYFVNRSLGVSGCCWIRSTSTSKMTIGTYAPYGFASFGSTPGGSFCANNVPLIISEFKDTALDPFDAFGQAVAAGSNGVICQLNAGLSWDQCRVFVICCTGGKYLFGFVTLLAPHFIHAGVISSVLDISFPPALEEAARLLVIIRTSSLEQQKLLKGGKNAMVQQVETSKISWEMYHLKPVERVLVQHEDRARAVGWCRFLHIYDKVFSSREIRDSVVFPLGFYKDQNGKLGGVLFPRLRGDWRIGLPEDELIHSAYLEELRRVLKVLHQHALLVHGDCCPCNISWKWDSKSNRISVKLLDFDTAVEVGEELPTALLDLKTSIGKECSWHSSGKAVAESDAWYCFLFCKIPAECRKSVPVDEEDGPAKVNDPFRKWLLEKIRGADFQDLCNEFQKWFESM